MTLEERKADLENLDRRITCILAAGGGQRQAAEARGLLRLRSRLVDEYIRAGGSDIPVNFGGVR